MHQMPYCVGIALGNPTEFSGRRVTVLSPTSASVCCSQRRAIRSRHTTRTRKRSMRVSVRRRERARHNPTSQIVPVERSLVWRPGNFINMGSKEVCCFTIICAIVLVRRFTLFHSRTTSTTTTTTTTLTMTKTRTETTHNDTRQHAARRYATVK